MLLAKHIYQAVIYLLQIHVQPLKQEHVIHTRQVVHSTLKMQPIAIDNWTLQENLVDMQHPPLNAKPNNVPIFLISQATQTVKHIYQVVISLVLQIFVQPLKQEHVILIGQLVPPTLKKQNHAIYNWTLQEMLVDM